MSLVSHAKRELELYFPDDPELVMCHVEIVSAFEAKAGQGVDVDILYRLFRGHHLGEITDDPEEWYHISKGMWQSLRDPRVLSDDGGRTYYIMTDDEEDHMPRIRSMPRKGTP